MSDVKHQTGFISAKNFIEHLNSQLQDNIFNDQISMKEINHPKYEIVYDVIHPELHKYNNTPVNAIYQLCLLLSDKQVVLWSVHLACSGKFETQNLICFCHPMCILAS